MRNRNGFTLIELLVVITIIAVLAGLLIPGILRAMKQAKTNRALSEMQHLATVICQVYCEVGYYVRLEDLTKTDSGGVLIWALTAAPASGKSDADLINTDSLILQTTSSPMWNGPYTTYKNYVSLTSPRPLDPWGNPTGLDADKARRQYRMFWISNTGAAVSFVPAGATGAMVIISAGGDGVYDCNIGTADSKKTPDTAVATSFATFNPSTNKGDDVYYIFNAGIQ